MSTDVPRLSTGVLISHPRSCTATGPDTLRLGCGAAGIGLLGDGGTLLSLPTLNLNRNGVSGVCKLSPSDTPLSIFGSVLILTLGGESCKGVLVRSPCPLSETLDLSCDPDDCEFDKAIISSAALRLCGCGERYSM